MQAESCRFEAGHYDVFHRVGSARDEKVQLRPVSFRERLEDVVGWVLAARRAPNAETQANIVLRAESLADGLQDKVFAMPPRDFEGVVTGDEMLKNSIDPHFNYHAAICFSKHELWDGDMFCNDRNLPSEDVLTNVNLILRCKRVGIYNKPIYNYHLVGTSLTMTGQYFNQTCFKNFFNQLKTTLKENGKEELMKDYVRMKEITSFGFLIKDIDTSDDWYKQVMAYDVNDYPRKIRLLHKLLHFPCLLKSLVGINRWQKRLLNF